LETAAVVHELLDTMKRLDGKFGGLQGQELLEGYRWIFSIAAVGLDAFVWGDTRRPRFVDIVGPYRKWGGDNADAFYLYAPLDPRRTYRVRGNKGDSVYFSLTVYGGPDDGRYSERIVATVNDRMIEADSDGNFEIMLSTSDGADLLLEPDAVCAITRDYVVHPDRDRRMTWSIECTDADVGEYRLTDADLARRFRAALTWVKDQSNLVPLGLGTPNVVDEPYPVPQQTFGWAAGDAAYAMGSFDLRDDQALVIRGRSPECAFWNLCLWNQFLHTYNSDYDRVTINGGQVLYEPDGSWEIVVASKDPDHANWVSTQGHPSGRIWFRWFHPSETPGQPTTEVVQLSGVTPKRST
jgi:hypothetical protein